VPHVAAVVSGRLWFSSDVFTPEWPGARVAARWNFRGDAGELVFQDPEGRVLPPTGEEGLRQEEACERVRQRLAREGRQAAFVPPVPRWDGAPPDHGRAVDSLCLTARRAGELAH
jgi:hypothetical protein